MDFLSQPRLQASGTLPGVVCGGGGGCWWTVPEASSPEQAIEFPLLSVREPVGLMAIARAVRAVLGAWVLLVQIALR